MQTNEAASVIKGLYRQARFAIKMQSISDRSLEAFVRVNVFGFSTRATEAERKKASAAAVKLIKEIKKGKSATEHSWLIPTVLASEGAREPWDAIRDTAEKQMRKMVATMPGFAFVDSIRGFGALGFGQIIGECGDITNYPNVAKIWKRLGYAPHKGHAMSSWKRDTWRKEWNEKALTSQEWIENPFAGQRYAVIFMIGESLFKHQSMSNGPYRAIYDARRERTKTTHPEWTNMHSHRDGMRIMMKELLKDLWVNWHKDAAKHVLGSSRVMPRPANSEQSDGRSIAVLKSSYPVTSPLNTGDNPGEANCGMIPRRAMPRKNTARKAVKSAIRAVIPKTNLPTSEIEATS